MTRALARGALVALLLALVVVPAADARQWAWLGVRIRDLTEQEMEEIAARHGISLAELRQINGINGKKKISTGQALLVPAVAVLVGAVVALLFAKPRAAAAR